MQKITDKVSEYNGYFYALSEKTPNSTVPDGPLFGNGDIGVTVGGVPERLTLWISKNDFWYGGYARDGGGTYSGVKCIGTIELCSETMSGARFSAVQRISDAVVEMELESETRRLHVTACSPYNRSLIIVKAVSRKGEIPFEFRLSPLPDEPLADCTSEKRGNMIKITKNYVREVEWESKSVAVGKALDCDNTAGVLREGESVTFAVSVHTNHDEEDYIASAENEIAALDEDKIAEYREDSRRWWEIFWSTSGISIPSEEKIEKFWYGSHYLMACCSKGGKFAPGLFGNWITTNAPAWNGDYHLNYNYQAPWWGVYSSNKVSVSDPYDKPLLDYIPLARKNARDRLANDGIYCKVGIGPLGLESSRMFDKDGSEAIDRPYWGQKSNAAYAAVNMIMRFYSTWDRDYAEKCALPFLTEVAAFWEDYLVFEDGRYVIYRDCIHESDGDPQDFNPILSLGLLRAVFGAMIDISEYLDINADKIGYWRHILTHLSTFPTMERNGRTIFRLTERGFDWCNGNSLAVQHIFPAGAIGLSSDERLLKIARDTISEMNRWADFNAFPTYYTAAVRVGYSPEVIIENLNRQIDTHSYGNFFIYYGGGGIECCSAVPTCINEMLFQSHEGVLRFFPVWDKNKDAAFYSLRGYGAFVVSAELEDVVIGDIKLFSEKGRDCSVLCPWSEGMTVYENGAELYCTKKETRDGVVCTFKTKPGTSYILRRVK